MKGLIFILALLLAVAVQAQTDKATILERDAAAMKLFRTNLDSALVLAQANFEELQYTEDPEIVIPVAKTLVRILCDHGHLDSAIVLGTTYLEKTTDNSASLRAELVLSVASASMQRGRFEEALELVFPLYQELEEIGDSTWLAPTCNVIGRTYGHSNNHEQAMKYFKICEQIYRETDQLHRAASVLGNIAITHWLQTKDLTGTIQYLKESYSVAESCGDSISMANALGNTGKFLMENDSLDSAAVYIENSLQISQNVGQVRAVMVNRSNLALIYSKQGDYEKAIESCKEGLYMARKFHYDEFATRLTHDLGVHYEDAGQLDSALAYFRAYRALNSELFSEEVIFKLSELEARYKQEKLEKQKAEAQARSDRFRTWALISILSAVLLSITAIYAFRVSRLRRRKNEALLQHNASVEAQKEALEQLLAEKQVLLKEIHHRVKNNLQVVSSLLHLQSQSMDDEDALKAIQGGQSRVESIALIHKKLYQTDHLSKIVLQDYLEQLLTQLRDTFELLDVEVQVNTHNITLNPDTAVPLGLIINEMATNSFKYAFPESKGKIQLDIEEEADQRFRMTFKDSGNGLPKGFSPEKTESLGVRLIHLLSIQLKGSLNYAYDQGARFILEFQESINPAWQPKS